MTRVTRTVITIIIVQLDAKQGNTIFMAAEYGG